MGVTIALYSHDSTGLGHGRRNRAIAHALADQLPALMGEPVGGVLIAGHPDLARDPLPTGWDWLVLPGVAPADPGHHRPRNLAMSLGELVAVRGAVMDAALAALNPDLLIVDRHAFGVAGELRSTLPWLRDRGCRVVLGLREVLDDPHTIAEEWRELGGAASVAAAYDALWIYGDPEVYDPRLTGEVPLPLRRLARTTGYLSLGRPESGGSECQSGSDVLTLLGGGADGGALARISVQAQAPAGHRHLVVTGPQMSGPEVEQIRRLAPTGTTVLTHIDDLPSRIEDAAAVVCMGGYNTVAEVLATSTPALVVPRHHRRKEQSRRAEALAAARAVDTRRLDDLTTAEISQFFATSIGRRVDRSHIDRQGLSRVPELAAALLQRHREQVGASPIQHRDEVDSHAG